ARYALTAAPDDPAHGAVTVAATGLFDKGDQVTVAAVPKAGYRLDQWTVDGRPQPTRAGELTVTMDGDHYVTARFVPAAAATTGPAAPLVPAAATGAPSALPDSTPTD
ncbi:InlB B-repeat-containing protein, partial [Streptomyces sp. YS-3]|uniref:InlB B-repeat-containing protein n=1 Tax=Streptomyces sp. YS-3 TaxID=3381352 RepID=UPI0038623676